MLKANELRIGNWVNYFDKPCMVKQIRHENTSFYLSCVDNMNDLTKYSNVIEAYTTIPLTPEILQRAGFTNGSGGDRYWRDITFHRNVSPAVTMRLVVDTLGCILWSKTSDEHLPSPEFNVKCLHQLQNLYFVLTGEELKIELTAYFGETIGN